MTVGSLPIASPASSSRPMRSTCGYSYTGKGQYAELAAGAPKGAVPASHKAAV